MSNTFWKSSLIISSVYLVASAKVFYNSYYMYTSPEPFLMISPWRFESRRYVNRYPRSIMRIPKHHIDKSIIEHIEDKNEGKLLLIKLCLVLTGLTERSETCLYRGENNEIHLDDHTELDSHIVSKINKMCKKRPELSDTRDRFITFHDFE